MGEGRSEEEGRRWKKSERGRGQREGVKNEERQRETENRETDRPTQTERERQTQTEEQHAETGLTRFLTMISEPAMTARCNGVRWCWSCVRELTLACTLIRNSTLSMSDF